MKRITKAQRQANELAALEKRLIDIYSGAIGGIWGDDDFATAEVLSKAVPAIKELFGIDPGRYLVSFGNIDNYDNPKRAAKFLYSGGIRA